MRKRLAHLTLRRLPAISAAAGALALSLGGMLSCGEPDALPPASPAATMLMNSRSKARGYFAKASERVEPPSMSSAT